MKNLITIAIIISINVMSCKAQDEIYIASWNVENLFDTIDDPSNPGDDEWLPGAVSNWTEEKLDKKQSNLARIIRSMNNGDGPDILGLCEIENKDVLAQTINKYLSDLDYEITHYDSPDPRGIDVALIYKSASAELISSEPINISIEGATRDILHCELKIRNDTLHVFVNHWPSRRGGEIETEPKRVQAASILRKKVDELFSKDKSARIIIMGDFNDMPYNKSILTTLLAVPFSCNSLSGEYSTNLFNTAYTATEKGEGSYFHQGNFNMLDQIIISKGLLDNKDLDFECGSFFIEKNELNTTKSGRFAGAPFPTFGSGRYLGGFSDHFPVAIKLKYCDD